MTARLSYLVRRKYSMISYGDSITHGYDAEYPSLALSSALSRMLGADNTNKAIAGDIFFPGAAYTGRADNSRHSDRRLRH